MKTCALVVMRIGKKAVWSGGQGWAEVIRQRSSEADSVLFVGVCVCVVTKHMRD